MHPARRLRAEHDLTAGDREKSVGGRDSWWDVPVAAISVTTSDLSVHCSGRPGWAIPLVGLENHLSQCLQLARPHPVHVTKSDQVERFRYRSRLGIGPQRIDPARTRAIPEADQVEGDAPGSVHLDVRTIQLKPREIRDLGRVLAGHCGIVDHQPADL